MRILVVTEEIKPPHTAVLGAGLAKLFKADPGTIILDLTGTPKSGTEVLQALLELRSVAVDLDAQLLIASPTEGLGDAATREELLEQLASPLTQLLSKEARLTAKLKKLSRRKDLLAEKVDALIERGGDILALRKENSDLKRTIRRLEEQIGTLLKERTSDPTSAGEIDAKFAIIDQTLSLVLEQEGILPVD